MNEAREDAPAPEVAIIGLGVMGAALARTQLEAGAGVHVWNRSPEKASPLVALGARHCADARAAIEAARIVVVCLADHDAWRELCAGQELDACLTGRIVVQLTTGTRQDARAELARGRASGALCLDGVILAFPRQIGTEQGMILLAGDEAAWEEAASVLGAFGSEVHYVGEDVELPCILDAAILASVLGTLVGTLNGAALAEAGGVSLATFAQLLAGAGHLQTEEMARIATALAEDRTEETEAALGTWAKIPRHMLEIGTELGVDTGYARWLQSCFERAEAAGLQEQDLSAMIGLLRPKH
ncbi:MAG: NAD(P)-binding domain-containing protein [Pseudomonadales bacterium]|jgi:3-hydroxyisobutyrate dehydrogenase-like beta-hydroxyacid dehydrogenase|nr:NAD(P)-binding domain-containing protein [Pseudomonadales bacterium]